MKLQPLPCPKCGADAVVQTRGDMGPGDYWQDRQEPPALFPVGPGQLGQDGRITKPVPYYKMVELDASSFGDRRVSCTVCDMETEWAGPTFREVVDRWNNEKRS